MSGNGPAPESDRLARAAAIMHAAGERAKAEIERATAEALAEILGDGAPMPEHDPSPPSPASTKGAAWVNQWGTIGEAERILRRSHDTVVKRVKQEGLGVWRHGRWSVCLNRVRAYIEGRPYPRLDPYPQAD